MKPLLQILHIAKLSVYSLALSGVLVSCSGPMMILQLLKDCCTLILLEATVRKKRILLL